MAESSESNSSPPPDQTGYADVDDANPQHQINSAFAKLDSDWQNNTRSLSTEQDGVTEYNTTFWDGDEVDQLPSSMPIKNQKLLSRLRHPSSISFVDSSGETKTLGEHTLDKAPNLSRQGRPTIQLTFRVPPVGSPYIGFTIKFNRGENPGFTTGSCLQTQCTCGLCQIHKVEFRFTCGTFNLFSRLSAENESFITFQKIHDQRPWIFGYRWPFQPAPGENTDWFNSLEDMANADQWTLGVKHRHPPNMEEDFAPSAIRYCQTAAHTFVTVGGGQKEDTFDSFLMPKTKTALYERLYHFESWEDYCILDVGDEVELMRYSFSLGVDDNGKELKDGDGWKATVINPNQNEHGGTHLLCFELSSKLLTCFRAYEKYEPKANTYPIYFKILNSVKPAKFQLKAPAAMYPRYKQPLFKRRPGLGGGDDANDHQSNTEILQSHGADDINCADEAEDDESDNDLPGIEEHVVATWKDEKIDYSNIRSILMGNSVTDLWYWDLFEGCPADKLELILANCTPKQRASIEAFGNRIPCGLLFIKGPPGSGKTFGLIAAIEIVLSSGEKVLAAAAQNTAVNNLFDRTVNSIAKLNLDQDILAIRLWSESIERDNQMRFSFISRMTLLAWPYWSMSEQLRMAPGMFDMPLEVYFKNAYSYGNQVLADFPLSILFEAWSITLSDTIEPSPDGKIWPIFIQCNKSFYHREIGGTSRRNTQTAETCLHMILSLIAFDEQVKKEDFVTVVPYLAQRQLYIQAKINNEESFGGIEVATSSAYQGHEKHFVFYDLPTASSMPNVGFVAEPKRNTMVAKVPSSQEEVAKNGHDFVKQHPLYLSEDHLQHLALNLLIINPSPTVFKLDDYSVLEESYSCIQKLVQDNGYKTSEWNSKDLSFQKFALKLSHSIHMSEPLTASTIFESFESLFRLLLDWPEPETTVIEERKAPVPSTDTDKWASRGDLGLQSVAGQGAAKAKKTTAEEAWVSDAKTQIASDTNVQLPLHSKRDWDTPASENPTPSTTQQSSTVW
ncbi:hypothetical protein BTUL_0190g00010 [Botrytis tulipae]|uniref:DNA2/NAM7 helicase helicase domain-containing protein n=1 Tax=Botrytis tulipae TaxID=87230 RepID=A0A4Z1EEK6_9HELO|nr:hypothetical protein BTUL_0190g00010 [Botrytis tulipae]